MVHVTLMANKEAIIIYNKDNIVVMYSIAKIMGRKHITKLQMRGLGYLSFEDNRVACTESIFAVTITDYIPGIPGNSIP